MENEVVKTTDMVEGGSLVDAVDFGKKFVTHTFTIQAEIKEACKQFRKTTGFPVSPHVNKFLRALMEKEGLLGK